MKVELVAVGTELLLGQLTDTNTRFIANALALGGIDVVGTHMVGDNRARIAQTIDAALERVDGVITTGGLGPTIDDLTKEAVCDALHLDTELNEPALAQMIEFFAMIKRDMRDNNRKQAELPRGSQVLVNPRGTAPGFVAFRADGKFVASMPGVPREMHPMLTELLIPLLRERFAIEEAIYTRVVRIINLGESEIDHRIDDLFRAGENPKIAVLAHEARCDVKIMAKANTAEAAEAMIAPVESEIVRRLDGNVYGYDSTTLEDAIHAQLQARGWRIGVAESCTGGRVSAALTQTPGSSLSFLGGVVAYDNAVKIRELGVPAEVLDTHGAVSEETVLAMARGGRTLLGVDVAVATTGIAGPDGGTPEKPVGLVWFAIDGSAGSTAVSVRFRGDRETIQRRAATMALGFVWGWLRVN